MFVVNILVCTFNTDERFDRFLLQSLCFATSRCITNKCDWFLSHCRPGYMGVWHVERSVLIGVSSLIRAGWVGVSSVLVEARGPLWDSVCLFLEHVVRQDLINLIVSAVNMTNRERITFLAMMNMSVASSAWCALGMLLWT